MAGMAALTGGRASYSRAFRTLVASIVVVVVLAGCLGSSGDDVSRDSEPSPGGTTPEASPASELTTNATPTVRTDGGSKRHPSLESTLAELVDADDREDFADERGLTLRDGRVEVVVELQAGRELPEEFDVGVQSRHEHLLQAFVAVDDLVPLSEHENVSYVRLPHHAQPDDSPTDSIHP